MAFLDYYFSGQRSQPLLKQRKLKDTPFQLLYVLPYFSLLEQSDKEPLLITMKNLPYREVQVSLLKIFDISLN